MLRKASVELTIYNRDIYQFLTPSTTPITSLAELEDAVAEDSGDTNSDTVPTKPSAAVDEPVAPSSAEDPQIICAGAWAGTMDESGKEDSRAWTC